MTQLRMAALMPRRTNLVYCGDVTEVLTNQIPDRSIDLTYVDPPFFSAQLYAALWGNGDELREFEDRWQGGVGNLAWMEPTLRECYRVQKRNGSTDSHREWNAGHRLPVLMDGIITESRFINEIVCKGRVQK